MSQQGNKCVECKADPGWHDEFCPVFLEQEKCIQPGYEVMTMEKRPHVNYKIDFNLEMMMVCPECKTQGGGHAKTCSNRDPGTRVYKSIGPGF